MLQSQSTSRINTFHAVMIELNVKEKQNSALGGKIFGLQFYFSLLVQHPTLYLCTADEKFPIVHF